MEATKAALRVTVKEVAEYRVARVEVRRSKVIDQIRFIYSDQSVLAIGHDSGGKADLQPMVLAEGEHLVRVEHEELRNLRCAATSVSFLTNRGRRWTFRPEWAREGMAGLRVVEAGEGREIVGLEVRHGVLVGSVQQPTRPGEGRLEGGWWAVGRLEEKEGEEQGVGWSHYTKEVEAVAAWKEVAARVTEKPGRGAVMVDCINRKEKKRVGLNDAVERCLESGEEAGLFTGKEEEGNSVSILQTILLLYRMLNTKQDTMFMLLIMLLLCTSFLLELEGEVLMGKVLALASDPSNSTWLLDNWYVSSSCSLFPCNEGIGGDLRLRLLLVMVLVSLAERIVYLANVFLHHMACEGRNFRMSVGLV